MTDTTTGTSVAIATPDLEIIEGQITTTSQQIAAHFGKVHRDVVRAIENIECSKEFRLRNFAQSSFEAEMPNGGKRKHKAYRLSRDGFVFLAMGFTGKDAAQWKEAYITAFNKMEQELLARNMSQTAPAIGCDYITTAQKQDLKELVNAIVATGKQTYGETWARLQSKFRVNKYEFLPASKFDEARDYLLGKLPEPEPIVNLNKTKAAFDAAAQAAASVQTAVFNAVLEGDGDWKFGRYLLAFIDDSSRGAPAYVRQMDRGDFITTWPRLIKDVANGECMCSSAELIELATACMQRLQQRSGPARLAA